MAPGEKRLFARFESAGRFRACVDAVKDLITDGTIQWNDEGMKLQGMALGNTALVMLALALPAFDKYSCPTPISLSLSLKNLALVLSVVNPNDWLTLKTVAGSDFLYISAQSPDLSAERSFQFRLMDIDETALEIPEHDHEVVVTMTSKHFKSLVGDAMKMGVHMDVTVDAERLVVHTEGDYGPFTVKLKHSEREPSPKRARVEAEEIKIVCSTPIVKQSFSVKMLDQFTKAGALSDMVHIRMSNDLPIEVGYRLPDKAGAIAYYLAPRVADALEQGSA